MPNLEIALVEDEAVLREELAFQLTHLGFTVESFEDASQLYRRLAVRRFTSVVLDIGLKGEDGLSVCNHLRAHDKQVGIVFVSARTLRDDRLSGFQAGADAYLSKPVDIDELALVLQRLGERTGQPQSPSPGTEPGPKTPSWQLESGGDFLWTPDGRRIRLSLNEARVLALLFNRPDEVITPTELARALGLLPDEYDKHRLEVILSRLRDKIQRESGFRLPVVARRGMGYVFRPDHGQPHP